MNNAGNNDNRVVLDLASNTDDDAEANTDTEPVENVDYQSLTDDTGMLPM